MADVPIGITFSETMAGAFALGATDPEEGRKLGRKEGTELALHANVAIDDLDRFIADPQHLGSLTGSVDFTPWGEGLKGSRGVFNLFQPSGEKDLKYMVYELAFAHQGTSYYLAGKKLVHDDPGLDLWSDTTTLYTQLHQGDDASGPVVGAGILTLGVGDLIRLVSTMRVTNAGVVDKLAALSKFGRFFLGELWDTYVGHLGSAE